jgi:hypothetical protein
MNRLNFFNPYESKKGQHEDQLTRAFLVVLKHSSLALFTFMDYCRRSHHLSGQEKPFSITEFLEDDWHFATQKGNPEINTDWLVSILITDSNIADSDAATIRSSERNARYDGVITFGSKLTMVIETKPRASKVWAEQLNPSQQNLASGTNVYASPIILEWKTIINQLSDLIRVPTISGGEKALIEDFLAFVDDKFPFLNPFDNFHQCKRNMELLYRRIRNVLASVVQDENKVAYHRKWGFYVQTPYSQIGKVGLILDQDQNDGDYSIELSLYFGDSQRQAIAFYNSNPNLSRLETNGWGLYPNFHVSFMSSNLVWFKSDDATRYLNFWKSNVQMICQYARADVPELFKRLTHDKIITVTTENEEQMRNSFYDTARQVLNICPGFGIIYAINSSDAEELDKKGKLNLLIAEKIREGLSVVGLDGGDLLKKT